MCGATGGCASFKIIVSRTLDRVGWANTRVVHADVATQLTELKRQPGKDIAIFGSSALTADLLALGLVDELRLIVNPGHTRPRGFTVRRWPPRPRSAWWKPAASTPAASC